MSESTDNKLFNWFEKRLMTPLAKLSQYKFVRAIANTGMTTIPLTIVGSMFLVLNVIPESFPALQGFWENTFLKFSDLYMVANKATMGILALYFSIVLGYELTKIYADEEGLDLSPITGSMLSVMALFMAIPQITWTDGSMQLVQSEDPVIVNGIEVGGDFIARLGTVGIFAAIVTAVLAVMIYKTLVEKDIRIKMPESVPAGVANGFTALIPAFAIAFAMILIQGILIFFDTDFFDLLAKPFGFVTNLTNSWLGVMVIVFLIHALWLVGIHGATIITSFITPITLANLQSNVEGATIPWAGEFNNAFVTIGGSGNTLVLTFWLVWRAKSAQLKAIGKAELIPAIFNINEPLIFGLPIIYNPALAIPFVLAPMVSASIGYFAITFGICSPIVAQMPWPTPVGLGAFVGTAGDWRAAVVSIIAAIVAGLVYYPFIKRYDSKLYKEEQANA